MTRDSKTGRFTGYEANFVVNKDGIIYCYDNSYDLLFFTDDERVLQYNWHKSANGYSSTRINGVEISAHRFVSEPREDQLVDHINRNKKDNRKCNLRNTDKSENAFNSKLRVTNKSGHTGVRYRTDTNKWTAEIKKNYRKYVLGSFDTKEEAIKARQEAEENIYGYKLQTEGCKV